MEVLKAQYRQANHERARVLAAMAQVGVCGLVPDDDLTRRVLPDEFSADEVRDRRPGPSTRPRHRQGNPFTAEADRRSPGAALRRYLEIRDRYCVMIGCRAPAHTADKDHTIDHAHSGPTLAPNL